MGCDKHQWILDVWVNKSGMDPGFLIGMDQERAEPVQNLPINKYIVVTH